MRVSRLQLKWIALFCMICDHAGCVFLEEGNLLWFVLRMVIGRIAFPVFAVLFVQGFFLTKHYRRHIIDLFVWGVIAEPFFDKMLFDTWIDWSHQNVMFTWALSFLLLLVFEQIFQWLHMGMTDRIGASVLGIGVTTIGCILAEYLHVDYGMIGVLSIILVYVLLKYKTTTQLWVEGGIVGLFLTICCGTVGAVLSVIPLLLYDGTKNCKRGFLWKYAFYLAYPLHMAVLCGLRCI